MEDTNYCSNHQCDYGENLFWYTAIAVSLIIILYGASILSFGKKFSSGKFGLYPQLLFLTITGYFLMILIFVPMFLIYFFLYCISVLVKGIANLSGNDITFATDLDVIWNSRSDSSRPFINIIAKHDGKHDFDLVKEFLINRIIEYREENGRKPFIKFTQRFQTYFGYLIWKDCENFDLNNHLKIIDLKKMYPDIKEDCNKNSYLKCSQQRLSRYVTDFGNKAVLKNQPQWQVNILLPGNEKEEFILNLKIHHAYGDGMSLMRLYLEQFSDEPVKISLLGKPPSTFQRFIYTVWAVAFVPFSFRHIFFQAQNNPLHGKTLTGKKIQVTSDGISLDYLKKIKAKAKTSMIDVLFSCVSFSIFEHFKRLNFSIDDIVVFFPVGFEDISAPIKLANTFAMGVSSLPMNIDQSVMKKHEKTPYLARLFETKKYFNFARKSPDVLALYYITTFFLSVVPVQLADCIFNSKGFTIGLSNVPGPQIVIKSCKTDVSSFRAWIPDSSPNGCGFVFMSYCGKLRIGFSVDEALINSRDEMEKIIDDFGKALKGLATELGIE